MRYLTSYIDPQTGRERLGAGADSQCYHEYANVKNVIRFGLTKAAFPAGQYNIYAAPKYGKQKFLTIAYKRV